MHFVGHFESVRKSVYMKAYMYYTGAHTMAFSSLLLFSHRKFYNVLIHKQYWNVLFFHVSTHISWYNDQTEE